MNSHVMMKTSSLPTAVLVWPFFTFQFNASCLVISPRLNLWGAVLSINLLYGIRLRDVANGLGI